MTTQPNGLADAHVLLVEDDPISRPTIERVLREAGATVRAVGTVREALAALAEAPGIVIVDVHLPDGSGLEVVEAANRSRPPPRIIAASGSADPSESFRLGQLHVDCYLTKPYGLTELRAAVAGLRTPTQELAAASARTVGMIGLIEARDVLRDSMVVEALEQSDGNRTQAARMLGVSRQAIQSAVRE